MEGNGKPQLAVPEHYEEIGFQINSLSHLIQRLMHQYIDQEEGPPSHAWMIGFLYANREKDVFQRDLQEQFSVRRSTMTGILQVMEKNGLITREGVGWDARLKKIRLTEKAIRYEEHFHQRIQEMEACLAGCLTPEERETFIELCQKLRRNLETVQDPRG